MRTLGVGRHGRAESRSGALSGPIAVAESESVAEPIAVTGAEPVAESESVAESIAEPIAVAQSESGAQCGLSDAVCSRWRGVVRGV
jgi:hypothetical protein